MSNTFQLISRALGWSGDRVSCDYDTEIQTCCITGELCRCVPRSALIGESFTTQGVFKAPDSEWVSEDAWYAFKHRPERASSWWTDGQTFRTLNRREAWDMLRMLSYEQYDLPYAMYVTKSYKKHGALVSPVNPGRSKTIVVGFEGETVNASALRYRQFMESLSSWRDDGIARDDIITGHLAKTSKATPDAVKRFLLEAPLMRGHSLYRMLTSILPGIGQEEETADGE